MQPWYPRCPPCIGLVAPVRPGRRGGPSAARLPADGMVTGWAALRLARAAWFDGDGRDVPVLLPHTGRIRAAGLEVLRTRGALPSPVRAYDVPCAPTLHALAHELRREPDLCERVVMTDMALLARALTIEQVRTLAEAVTRGAETYVTGECRSAPEVRMSLVWQLDAGFARPLMNREVLAPDGRRVAIVDLLDPGTGTYGEYDGEMHRSRARHRSDTERADALRGLGMESFTVVAGDSREVQVRRMAAARGRATARSRPGTWQVGRHIPMARLSRDLTTEEMEQLTGWGTTEGS